MERSCKRAVVSGSVGEVFSTEHAETGLIKSYTPDEAIWILVQRCADRYPFVS